MARWLRTHKRALCLGKRCFVITQYVKDLKQDQKIVPDLVEWIIKPANPVKAGLRRILMNTVEFLLEADKTGKPKKC